MCQWFMIYWAFVFFRLTSCSSSASKTREWETAVELLFQIRRNNLVRSWLVLSRATRSNVEKCDRFSFSSSICQSRMEGRKAFGWHVLRTLTSHRGPGTFCLLNPSFHFLIRYCITSYISHCYTNACLLL